MSAAHQADLKVVADTMAEMQRHIEKVTGARHSMYDAAVAIARDHATPSPEPTPAAKLAEQGRGEAIADVISHASDWRTALTAMRDNAEEPEVGVQDDRSYWQHQLDVLDRILAALSTPEPAGEVEGEPVEIRSCTECDFIGLSEEASADVDVCSSCGGNGAHSGPDRCEHCGEAGTMCLACPKCGGRFSLERSVRRAARHTERCWGRTSYSDEVAHCYCPKPSEADTLATLLDNVVISQSLSKELRQQAIDAARSYLYDRRQRLAALNKEGV